MMELFLLALGLRIVNLPLDSDHKFVLNSCCPSFFSNKGGSNRFDRETSNGLS
jgi:hypothetical protein